MKVLIVEDNPAAKALLEGALKELYPYLTSIRTSNTIADGLKQVQTDPPDLAFLDVELPDGTSFELLQQLNRIDFKIIFTTAHEKYALQAIKYSALDYLLTPIDLEELVAAMEKVQEDAEKENMALKIDTLLKNLQQDDQQRPKRLILKDKYGIQIVNIDDIIHLEAMGNYTKFFIKKRTQPIVNSKILKAYTKLLPEATFFRCHQSHLVNINYLSRYDKREGEVLCLKNGSRVPLATRKREALLKIIKTL